VNADVGLWRELRSLHEELSASHRGRRARTADRTFAREATVTPASQLKDAAEVQGLQGELHEFINMIKEFVTEAAEKNVSAHPVANVIGAMIAGILIGRLLGRH